VRSASRLDVLEFGIPSGCPLLDGPTSRTVTLGARGLDTETALALGTVLVEKVALGTAELYCKVDELRQAAQSVSA